MNPSGIQLRTFTITDEDRTHLIAMNCVFEQLLTELARRVTIPHKLPRKFSEIEEYLFAENELFADSIDRWVKEFIANKLDCRRLPNIDDNPQLFFLIQRVKCARMNVVDLLLRKGPRVLLPPASVAEVPAASDHSAFIRWLLIPEWKRLGESRLKDFAFELLQAFGALGPHQLTKLINE